MDALTTFVESYVMWVQWGLDDLSALLWMKENPFLT